MESKLTGNAEDDESNCSVPKENIHHKDTVKSTENVEGEVETEDEAEISRKTEKLNKCIKQLDKNGIEYVSKLIENGDEEAFRLLLSARKDIMEMKDEDGNTPFLLAEIYNHLNIMKILAQHGCNVAVKDNDGWNAIHCASSHNHGDCLVWLCQSYPHLIDEKDNTGWTAMYGAVIVGNLNTLKILLRNNADILVKDDNGCNAIDIAKQHRKREYLQEMQEALRKREEIDDGKYKDCNTIEEYHNKYGSDDSESDYESDSD